MGTFFGGVNEVHERRFEQEMRAARKSAAEAADASQNCVVRMEALTDMWISFGNVQAEAKGVDSAFGVETSVQKLQDELMEAHKQFRKACLVR